MEKVFLVKWCSGATYNFYYENIFVTTDEQKAQSYVERFNNLLSEYRKFYSRYEEDHELFSREEGFFGRKLKDEFIDRYFDRWCLLKRISFCTYEPVELR